MFQHLGDVGKQDIQALPSCRYKQMFPIPDGCYLVSLPKQWNYTEIEKESGQLPDTVLFLFSKSCTESLTGCLGAGIAKKKLKKKINQLPIFLYILAKARWAQPNILCCMCEFWGRFSCFKAFGDLEI